MITRAVTAAMHAPAMGAVLFLCCFLYWVVAGVVEAEAVQVEVSVKPSLLLVLVDPPRVAAAWSTSPVMINASMKACMLEVVVEVVVAWLVRAGI
jgi:hypothetical protein